MSMTLSTNETPICSDEQLAEYLATGSKPPERHLIGTALFANSPFVDGRPSAHLSARAEVGRHVDPVEAVP